MWRFEFNGTRTFVVIPRFSPNRGKLVGVAKLETLIFATFLRTEDIFVHLTRLGDRGFTLYEVFFDRATRGMEEDGFRNFQTMKT
jgi:hypothetical protein